MKLDFDYPAAGQAKTRVKISKLYEGYPDVIHGGILSALLDEVMAKAVINSGAVAFTAKLSISYRQPLTPEDEVEVIGMITSAKQRIIHTRAEIRNPDKVFAEAEAVFVVPKEKS